MIKPIDWEDADFVGLSVSQEKQKHCALHAIPMFSHPGRHIAPPSNYHTGYRIKIAEHKRVNQPWRHVYQSVRGYQMVHLAGRWQKLTPGSELAMQYLAHAKEAA